MSEELQVDSRDFDYVRQLRTFERMIALNPFSVSQSGQVLWMRLNGIADRQRKSVLVHISHKDLEKLMAVTEYVRLKATYELVALGLIKFRQGRRSNLPMYDIKLLYQEGGKTE